MSAIPLVRARLERRAGAGSSRGSWPALAGLVPVGALAADQGGYFPSAWGWATLGLLWAAGLALVLRAGIRVGRAQAAFVLAWAAVAAWIALSALWSTDVPQTVLEIERALVYVAGAAVLVLIGGAGGRRQLLGGLLSAIAAISMFSLATRLFPNRIRVYDPTAIYRLAQPIGYWNGLSIFTVIGMMLALGFATRGRAVATRAAAAALLVFLFATFYFTFGRTGWIAFAAGLAAAIAIDRRRLQLLALTLLLAPILVAATWSSSRYPGLTHLHATLAQATHDGDHLAVTLMLLAAAAAALASVFALAERRVSVPATARRAFVVAVIAVCAATAIAVFARFGSPTTLVDHGWHAFRAPPPQEVDLNNRLLNFSGNGRYDLWRLAWDDAQSHPWLGSGAGSYERYFLAHQPSTVSRVRDAHGLYIETLAELGPFGLALLVAALAIPLVVALRRPRGSLTAAAVGAYVAFLVHAGSDWDWELPSVTLAALVCGAALLTAGRSTAEGRLLGTRLRVSAAVAIVAIGIFASVGLVGNSALNASASSLSARQWSRAETQARRAATWNPWSPAPWDALGNAELGANEVAAARASFRKAVSIDPGDWSLWLDLAQATVRAEHDRALEQARTLYPKFQDPNA